MDFDSREGYIYWVEEWMEQPNYGGAIMRSSHLKSKVRNVYSVHSDKALHYHCNYNGSSIIDFVYKKIIKFTGIFIKYAPKSTMNC